MQITVETPEIHVEGVIHEFFTDFSYGQHVEGHPNL